MDLISNRTIEITKLGMDGLMDRQHAIASNIANVMTPDFQRKEVAFESQLAEIIEKEDLKDYIKGQNSIEYTTDLWYNNSRYTVFGGMPPPENPPQAEKHYGGIPSWIRLWNKSWQNARAARNTPLFSAL